MSSKPHFSEETRAYYRSTWGFDPVEHITENGTRFVENLPLDGPGDENLDKAGIWLQVITKISPLHCELVFVSNEGRRQEHNISCIHAVVHEGTLDDLSQIPEEGFRKLVSVEGTPAILEPVEHFAALRSFAIGLSEIGITNACRHNILPPRLRDEIEQYTKRFTITRVSDTRALRTIERLLGYTLAFREHVSLRDGGIEKLDLNLKHRFGRNAETVSRDIYAHLLRLRALRTVDLHGFIEPGSFIHRFANRGSRMGTVTSLYDCYISRIPALLPSRATLNIYRGEAEQLAFESIKEYYSLAVVNTPLAPLPEGIRAPEKLILKNTGLTAVPELDYQNTNWLDVSENQISTIPPDTFPDSLSYLTLSANPLQQVPDLPRDIRFFIAEMIGLDDLSVLKNIRARYPYLLTLSLANNPNIHTIPEGVVTGRYSSVSLNNCGITTVENIPGRIGSLDLGYNQIEDIGSHLPTCNCLRLDACSFREFPYEIFEKLTPAYDRFERVSLRHNAIRSIDLDRIKNISVLYLHGNPIEEIHGTPPDMRISTDRYLNTDKFNRVREYNNVIHYRM